LRFADRSRVAFYNRAASLPMMNLTALPAFADSACNWRAF
jgi:hypothetical protein